MKDFAKEIGKYFLDISKIILTVAIITPLVNGKEYSIVTVIVSAIIFLVGAYIIFIGGLIDE